MTEHGVNVRRPVVRIVVPGTGSVRTGNRQTAERWAAMLEATGATVHIAVGGIGPAEPIDVLIVLHALKGRASMLECTARHPGTPIVLVLTGTDIYGDGDIDALHDSMSIADRLVVLQKQALQMIPDVFRDKTVVIPQSVPALADGSPNDEPRSLEPRSVDPFIVCVIGHLRDVKDPMRAAAAARLLPADSRIRVCHAGGILEPKYERLVEREMDENPRYEYLGELDPTDARVLISRSQTLVLSSRSEGGPAVVGEAVVAGTPVLASRIAGVIGLLGDDYPGYFPVADTGTLATLMERVESDEAFRRTLSAETVRHAPQFDPAREAAAWQSLLDELIDE